MSDTISVQVLDGGDTINAGVVEVVDRAAVVAEALALADPAGTAVAMAVAFGS